MGLDLSQTVTPPRAPGGANKNFVNHEGKQVLHKLQSENCNPVARFEEEEKILCSGQIERWVCKNCEII